MMYAENAGQACKRRKAFLAKWRPRCEAVADSLEEAGERLFTFPRYPPGQWKSLRTTNSIERGRWLSRFGYAAAIAGGEALSGWTSWARLSSVMYLRAIPLVVLFHQDGADEADDGRLVGKDADHVGAGA